MGRYGVLGNSDKVGKCIRLIFLPVNNMIYEVLQTN